MNAALRIEKYNSGGRIQEKGVKYTLTVRNERVSAKVKGVKKDRPPPKMGGNSQQFGRQLLENEELLIPKY